MTVQLHIPPPPALPSPPKTFDGLLKVTPSGKKVVSLELPIAYFLDFTTTEVIDAAVRKGYQRPTNHSKAKKVADHIYRNETVPPVVGNIRDRDMAHVKVVTLLGKPAKRTGHVRITIPSHVIARLIDGGHRQLGYHYFAERGWNSPEDSVSVYLHLGLTSQGESAEFKVINTSQQKISPSHVAQIAANETQEITEAEARKSMDAKEFDSYVRDRIIEGLESAGVWSDGMIHRSGTGPNAGQRVTYAAFHGSLKWVTKAPSLYDASVDDFVQILAAYWEAIAQVFPEAFEGGLERAKEWSVQGGTAVNGFHAALPNILELVQRLGLNRTDASSYVVFLKRLESMGYDNSQNPPREVAGLEFFRKGTTGAVGRFSNRGNYLPLADMMFNVIISG